LSFTTRSISDFAILIANARLVEVTPDLFLPSPNFTSHCSTPLCSMGRCFRHHGGNDDPGIGPLRRRTSSSSWPMPSSPCRMAAFRNHCARHVNSSAPAGRSSQSPRLDLSTLCLRRMYRALASGTKSVATGASLSGATTASQRRAGISHKSISAGIVGSPRFGRGALLRLLASENVEGLQSMSY
jgi:hypothetical protein